MVNKLMWEVDRDDESLEEFKTDPRSFLDGWEARYERPTPPFPDGGTLTRAERSALEGLDYSALYAMGANPFLLWQFARSVSVPHLMDIGQLIESYRQAVEPHGYPDFDT
jgi:hypothetical protein